MPTQTFFLLIFQMKFRSCFDRTNLISTEYFYALKRTREDAINTLTGCSTKYEMFSLLSVEKYFLLSK